MSNALKALVLMNDALTLATNIGAALRMIEREGRDLTDTELDAVRNGRMEALQLLDDEIARRRPAVSPADPPG